MFDSREAHHLAQMVKRVDTADLEFVAPQSAHAGLNLVLGTIRHSVATRRRERCNIASCFAPFLQSKILKDADQMKSRRNVETLMRYLRVHQPATVVRMAEANMMNTRDVSDAMRYGVRWGVFEREKCADIPGRAQYKLTGQSLAANGAGPCAPSFDALLAAWGFPPVPLASDHKGRSRKVLID